MDNMDLQHDLRVLSPSITPASPRYRAESLAGGKDNTDLQHHLRVLSPSDTPASPRYRADQTTSLLQARARLKKNGLSRCKKMNIYSLI